MNAPRYSATLRRVAPFLGGDMLRSLASIERMEGIRADEENFPLAQALYWHCAESYHGQGDPLYSALCALDYSPGACERGDDADNPYGAAFDVVDGDTGDRDTAGRGDAAAAAKEPARG